MSENRHPVVDEALNTIPPDPNAPGQHGQCAECQVIPEYLHAYEAQTGTKVTTIQQARQVLQGTKVQTAEVRGPNSTSGVHGQPKAPCEVCQPLLDIFGIEYIGD